MEFKYPGTSLFTPDGKEIVAWSVEEFAAKLEQGCTMERPAVVAVQEPEVVKPKQGRKGVVQSIAPPEPEAA